MLSQQTTDAKRETGAKRRPYPKRADDRARRRLSGPVLASIIVHVVAGAALLRVLLIPYPFTSLFGKKEQTVVPERISFLALPQESATQSPGKSGSNGRPENARETAAPPLVAPAAVPT